MLARCTLNFSVCVSILVDESFPLARMNVDSFSTKLYIQSPPVNRRPSVRAICFGNCASSWVFAPAVRQVQAQLRKQIPRTEGLRLNSLLTRKFRETFDFIKPSHITMKVWSIVTAEEPHHVISCFNGFCKGNISTHMLPKLVVLFGALAVQWATEARTAAPWIDQQYLNNW